MLATRSKEVMEEGRRRYDKIYQGDRRPATGLSWALEDYGHKGFQQIYCDKLKYYRVQDLCECLNAFCSDRTRRTNLCVLGCGPCWEYEAASCHFVNRPKALGIDACDWLEYIPPNVRFLRRDVCKDILDIERLLQSFPPTDRLLIIATAFVMDHYPTFLKDYASIFNSFPNVEVLILEALNYGNGRQGQASFLALKEYATDHWQGHVYLAGPNDRGLFLSRTRLAPQQ